MGRWIWLLVTLAVAALPVSAAAAVKGITALSSRPDRVSGGDVLVQIAQDDDASTAVTLNGADVTGAFQAGPAHTRIGLVTGLKQGPNTLAAGGVRLVVRNYPISGPIISGPHESPFICTTRSFQLYAALTKAGIASDEVLGPAIDDDCSVKTKITYLYWPRAPRRWRRFPARPRCQRTSRPPPRPPV